MREYVKIYCCGDCINYDWKKLCGRAVRRKLKRGDELLQRNMYRKVSEYQWKCW